MGLWKHNYDNLFGRSDGRKRKAGSSMENTEKEPRGFYVEKGSFFAHAAVTLLVLSIAARLLGTMKLWGNMPQMIIQILLPTGSALLFILFIILFGRVALWTTILPVLGGAAFFTLSIFDKGPGWPLFICIALAFLTAFLYTATLSGMIRTKWLLALVLLLIFAYQVYLAIPLFRETDQTLSFADGMAQISSLGLVFAIFCASLALRRKKAAKIEPELPKIKDPVVIPPAEKSTEESSDAAQPEAASAVSESAEAVPIIDEAVFDAIENEAASQSESGEGEENDREQA